MKSFLELYSKEGVKMKISEFIEKLQDFKKEYGNLEIGICRANLSESDYEYYADIELHKVNSKDTKLFVKYDDYKIKSVEKFCGMY